jgi:hypothetical protein
MQPRLVFKYKRSKSYLYPTRRILADCPLDNTNRNFASMLFLEQIPYSLSFSFGDFCKIKEQNSGQKQLYLLLDEQP